MSPEPAPQAFRLPADATSFVGRETELSEIATLLDGTRLVTLTGTAGVGKTRLALRAAALAAPRYPDGICLAELSSLRDPRLLPHTIAPVLGLPASSSMDAIVGYLGDRKILLILDTCEHLVGACHDFAAAVTRETSGVTVLATSRQPLGAPGEVVLMISPLPVTPPGAGRDGDAADLFAQRAASTVSSFTITDANRDDVLRVCQRLAGIPLAIELAAVRLRVMSLRQLADGLAEHVLSLTGSRRTSVPRHRELRTAIGWSYDLCTPVERELWARLSVFAGGFDAEAAAQVCADGSLAAGEIERTLDGLANKSVLLREPAGDRPPRYRLLDSLREFGAEALRESGAQTALRTRHIARYLAIARQHADDPMRGQARRHEALSADHDNLRAAIEYALTVPGNDGAAVRIVTSLVMHWSVSGRIREAEYWLDRVLEHCPPRAPARAELLVVRALTLAQLGEHRQARDDAEAGIKIARDSGDAAIAARGAVALHHALTWSDELGEASAIADAAVAELEAAGDAIGLALLDIQTALGHLQAKDLPGCQAASERGLRRLPPGELWARGYLVGLAGAAQFLMGREAAGAAGLREAVTLKHELRDIIGTAYAVSMLGIVAAFRGQYQRAAWLLGASGTLWEHSGRWYAGNPLFEEMHAHAVETAVRALGPERWRILTGRAAMASMDEIVALAMTEHGPAPAIA